MTSGLTCPSLNQYIYIYINNFLKTLAYFYGFPIDSVINDGFQSVIYSAGYFTGKIHCGGGMCLNEYLIHPYAVDNPV